MGDSHLNPAAKSCSSVPEKPESGQMYATDRISLLSDQSKPCRELEVEGDIFTGLDIVRAMSMEMNKSSSKYDCFSEDASMLFSLFSEDSMMDDLSFDFSVDDTKGVDEMLLDISNTVF